MANGDVGPQQHYFDSREIEKIETTERTHLHIAPQAPIRGLALSGGGIRSASFALGVMQALHSAKVFENFDYLSTVSGGGYIGGALTYFRNCFASFGQHWFPFGYEDQSSAGKVRAMAARAAVPDGGANERSQQIVSYIRQHASYMTPSRKFDRPALVAGVLRGLVSTVLPYFAILSGLFGLMICAGFFDATPPWTAFWSANAASTETAPAADSCVGAMCGAPESCVKAICAALADRAPEPEKAPPGFFLGAVLGAVALAIAVVVLLTFLASSILAGMVHRHDDKERFAQQGYSRLIVFYRWAGKLLIVTLALLCLATLPWVHLYLNSLWQAGGKLPATFAALFGSIGGAATLAGRLRSVTGGEAVKPSPLHAARMAVAGVAFVYGFLLLGYGASVDLLGAKSVLAAKDWHWANLLVPLIVFTLGIFAASQISINLATQHRIYRDRLMEVFCAQKKALISGEWARAKRAQSPLGWLINMTKRRRPYHLINACLVTSDSNKRRYRGRGGDNFVMSPLFCGSDATGWVKTETGMKPLSLATAIAVSGAALNAHAGPHGTGLLRNKAYAALLGLLGLNLGVWLPNPKRFAPGAKPPAGIPNLLNPGYFALSGRKLNENGAYIQLSDGGHFENLAIYELIRRKVDFLWISDAGQDAGFSFEDLGNAIERVRVDFGVNIRFQYDEYDLSHLIPGSATSDNPAGENFIERYKLATRGYAIGTVEYPHGKTGVVVYVKSTLTRGLPGDLYGYKARNGEYPHQTTLDQFFDEDQFEAYRELGYRLATKLFRDIDKARRAADMPDRTTGSEPLDKVVRALGI